MGSKPIKVFQNRINEFIFIKVLIFYINLLAIIYYFIPIASLVKIQNYLNIESIKNISRKNQDLLAFSTQVTLIVTYFTFLEIFSGRINFYPSQFLKANLLVLHPVLSPLNILDRPLGVLVAVGGEDVRKVCRRVNKVQILCIHVCKWKNETC
jgi:hypothetical protein